MKRRIRSYLDPLHLTKNLWCYVSKSGKTVELVSSVPIARLTRRQLQKVIKDMDARK